MLPPSPARRDRYTFPRMSKPRTPSPTPALKPSTPKPTALAPPLVLTAAASYAGITPRPPSYDPTVAATFLDGWHLALYRSPPIAQGR